MSSNVNVNARVARSRWHRYLDIHRAALRVPYSTRVRIVSSYATQPSRRVYTIIIQTFVFSTNSSFPSLYRAYLLSFGVEAVNAHLPRPIRAVGTIRLKAILFSPRGSPPSISECIFAVFMPVVFIDNFSPPRAGNRRLSDAMKPTKRECRPCDKSLNVPGDKARLDRREDRLSRRSEGGY